MQVYRSLLKFVAKSPLLTAIYYYFKGIYYFEQRATLMGRISYLESVELDSGMPFHPMIRNIHSLEKGLSMRHQRSLFGESYIAETIEYLERVLRNTSSKGPDFEAKETISWAFDVLAEYFRVVEMTPAIQNAQEKFQRLLRATQYEPGTRVPYARSNRLGRSSISYEALKQLAIQRRSVRWYEQRSVPREDIDRAIAIAALSPSACNRQPFEFRVYDDPALIKQISELPIGIAGFKDNIPCLVVLIGKLSPYWNERDRHVIYIDASLAAMAFEFALETLGLASCSINWPAIYEREKAMHELLNLAADERVVMLISVGYPALDGFIPYSQKKSLQMLRSYNKI